ncbi:MAG: phage virion morphogenesis protein [Azonexus sp.]|jgi:phage gpG-like protein|nr:phage virion morphogenesis protein [Azonexus sp.]
MQFIIELQADHLTAIMEAARRAIATPREMLTSIGEELQQANQERHRQGLDPEGRPWQELAESTKKAGPRKGGPLNRTGRMLRNFHYQADNDSVRLGFDGGDGFPAIYHQEGSSAHVITARRAKALKFGGLYRKRVNHPGLPARPLIGFPDSDRRRVEEVIVDHLTQVINAVR